MRMTLSLKKIIEFIPGIGKLLIVHFKALRALKAIHALKAIRALKAISCS